MRSEGHIEAIALGLAGLLISAASGLLWRGGQAVTRHVRARISARRARRAAREQAERAQLPCAHPTPRETPAAKRGAYE